ncbi:unnamed protein product [Zymoseptoria tritici ST99CH_1A5]|uniref:Endo-rhamnogalacturonase n=4 Tax=Zymoseptoria tritici TaxID=1047171 RepID=F9XPF2_ZYMTI|nr:putative endo-rhamnogalacturonase [Zymoseptoria tritici IPO323]SMQ55551.1 unnamed protein product [Zymoseptoria tritici ST99CH_3D7]SMR60748.1 unnamed protein product [Zymoseptoria tritici ST99CH_1E4]SMR63882.1 unnamed protein product [Zymoseptoria tritici ST99CH_3D1]SMY29234.1 unnamed protein product [Zymoseptoria tritici ST99CH_1A5]EGP82832.1 putative endo-rhamnogalacturonase [Zymoseptoria tritici IPO323]
MLTSSLAALCLWLSCVPLVLAQLTGPVGPLTPLAHKTKICNILDYGGVADNTTNVAPAIHKAFAECVQRSPGTVLYVPNGNYLVTESIVLANATNWAFQLDGLITVAYGPNYAVPREVALWGIPPDPVSRANTIDGEGDGRFLLDVILIVNANDFEFHSSDGRGAIQGQGYLYRNANNAVRPRLIRIIGSFDASFHDLILVDSPQFHIITDFCVNIEVYHLTIRGANLGSFDGIDVVGQNCWIHDCEVTNRDECVSLKSPSRDILVENLVCNQAGSSISIGSLHVGAIIENIVARNISAIGVSNIIFIKTYPGGSGFARNMLFENFRSKGSLYGVTINQYWKKNGDGDTSAVKLSDITFRNVTGSLVNGSHRPPLFFVANDLVMTTNITVEDVTLWTETGTEVINKINNVYGHGDSIYGPNDGLGDPNSKLVPFNKTATVTTPPDGWTLPNDPSWALPAVGYGTDSEIPVYAPAPLWKAKGDYDKHYWGSF